MYFFKHEIKQNWPGEEFTAHSPWTVTIWIFFPKTPKKIRSFWEKNLYLQYERSKFSIDRRLFIPPTYTLRDLKWAFIAFRQYFLWDMRAPQTYLIAFWIRSMSFWYQIIFIFWKSQYNTNFMTNYKNLIFFKFLIYNSPRSKLYKSNDIFLKCM